jgi:hypothetical protein
MGAIHSSDGTFEFQAVQPGSYILASDYRDEKVSMTGRLVLEVGTTNIDNVVLTVAPSLEVSGKVVIEGKTDLSPANIAINLEPKATTGREHPFASSAPDGSFVLKSVLPEQYDLNAWIPSASLYLKSIQVGDVDVTDTGLDFTQGVPAQLTLVLSPTAGQIEGAVQDDNQKPVAGATVMLIPEPPRRSQKRLYRGLASDAKGHFLLSGIAPGDYKLFAWEEIEPGAHEDPDFLKLFESRGEPVAIKENSVENRTLTVIPADDNKQ